MKYLVGYILFLKRLPLKARIFAWSRRDCGCGEETNLNAFDVRGVGGFLLLRLIFFALLSSLVIPNNPLLNIFVVPGMKCLKCLDKKTVENKQINKLKTSSGFVRVALKKREWNQENKIFLQLRLSSIFVEATVWKKRLDL